MFHCVVLWKICIICKVRLYVGGGLCVVCCLWGAEGFGDGLPRVWCGVVFVLIDLCGESVHTMA